MHAFFCSYQNFLSGFIVENFFYLFFLMQRFVISKMALNLHSDFAHNAPWKYGYKRKKFSLSIKNLTEFDLWKRQEVEGNYREDLILTSFFLKKQEWTSKLKVSKVQSASGFFVAYGDMLLFKDSQELVTKCARSWLRNDWLIFLSFLTGSRTIKQYSFQLSIRTKCIFFYFQSMQDFLKIWTAQGTQKITPKNLSVI